MELANRLAATNRTETGYLRRKAQRCTVLPLRTVSRFLALCGLDTASCPPVSLSHQLHHNVAIISFEPLIRIYFTCPFWVATPATPHPLFWGSTWLNHSLFWGSSTLNPFRIFRVMRHIPAIHDKMRPTTVAPVDLAWRPTRLFAQAPPTNDTGNRVRIPFAPLAHLHKRESFSLLRCCHYTI